MNENVETDLMVVYHSGDFDGKFCHAVACRRYGDSARYVGWNFGDSPVNVPAGSSLLVMDLPCDAPFGGLDKIDLGRTVWIDHHKTSIASHPASIPGYRLDGVAACRLAWQWFFGGYMSQDTILEVSDFVDRRVVEPLAIRLAGEYDVWDKRDDRADAFQYGLRSQESSWSGIDALLESGGDDLVAGIVQTGRSSQVYAKNVDAENMKCSFLVDWEGFKFLCLNGRGNSLTFASRDKPETGHDALAMFFWNGTKWVVSLYHARHNTGLDLSVIAKRMGGGGHRGACGFTCSNIPFLS